MTRDIGQEAARQIAQRFPGLAVEATPGGVVVPGEALLEITSFLKVSPELAFDYLAAITAVDYLNHFEVLYHLTSIAHNHSLVLKVRLPGRENLVLPSLTSLWQGADFQEREVYDLMGIAFRGHANMKRIFLWEGFPGHPLRKDFIYELS